MDALEHITLTSGGSRISPRHEVSDEVIAQLRADIAGSRPLNGTPWSVKLTPSPSGTFVFDLYHDGKRMIACWLCVEDKPSDRLWEIISSAGLTPPGVRLHKPSMTPWLAATLILTPDMLGDMTRLASVLTRAGDLERCVAWALIE